MPKFDHHLHTERHSPDSIIDPEELLELARRRGLDGIVLTDHDYQWESEELADLAARARPLGLTVLSGVEVSAREGHFLVYGLPDLADVGPGITLDELLRIANAHEAAVVAAHPFRWEQPFDHLFSTHGVNAFAALELVSNNVEPTTRRRTQAILSAHVGALGATGSSDGHDLDVIGCYYTRFEDPIESITDFVRALKSRRYRPGHGEGIRLSSGPVES